MSSVRADLERVLVALSGLHPFAPDETRPGGRSHRVDEMSDWDAIERGANVLLHTLIPLAN